MDIKNFEVVGISFKKTDVATRGKFNIAAERAAELYRRAPENADFVIVSTCNRTEIFGFSTPQYFDFLTMLLGDFAEKQLEKFTYRKRGFDAVRHLFLVTSGLDSQILGDYEIVGQVKKAFAAAKLFGSPSGLTERIFNLALQVSKKIKTETRLSDGSLSVAHAAVSLLKKNIFDKTKTDGGDVKKLKIVVVGLGNIGLLTIKNLLKIVDSQQVTLINRTFGIANAVAFEHNCRVAEFSELPEIVAASDVIFTAATTFQPFIFDKMLENTEGAILAINEKSGYTNDNFFEPKKSKIVFDLAVPSNVAATVRDLPNVQFYDVDMISKTTETTRAARISDVPKAVEIVDNQLVELEKWLDKRAEKSAELAFENGAV